MIKNFLRTSAASLLLFVPSAVFAANELWIYCGNLPGCSALPGLPVPFEEKFSAVLILLFQRLPQYAYTFGILFIMIGGAYILTSAGDTEKVTKGKNTITWAVIGIFVAEFASDFVNFIVLEVNNRLTGTDLFFSVANTLMSSIFDLMYIAILGIALFCGMRMVVSFGKEEEFSKARQGLFYAALGAIIINLAQQLVNAFSTL
jgi:hypothetical protein